MFIEVKARWSGRFGGAVAAVYFRKQRRLINMARGYLMGLQGFEFPCWFDVVGVALTTVARPLVDVIVDAFEVS